MRRGLEAAQHPDYDRSEFLAAIGRCERGSTSLSSVSAVLTKTCSDAASRQAVVQQTAGCIDSVRAPADATARGIQSEGVEITATGDRRRGGFTSCGGWNSDRWITVLVGRTLRVTWRGEVPNASCRSGERADQIRSQITPRQLHHGICWRTNGSGKASRARQATSFSIFLVRLKHCGFRTPADATRPGQRHSASGVCAAPAERQYPIKSARRMGTERSRGMRWATSNQNYDPRLITLGPSSDRQTAQIPGLVAPRRACR
jgi:hypothetical protein